MRQVNVNILSAADTSSQNGSQIDSNQLVSGSFHAYFGDASANGTFKILNEFWKYYFGNI